MLRYKTETRPGLVALYDIRPGNGAGPFLQRGARTGLSVNGMTCTSWLAATANLAVRLRLLSQRKMQFLHETIRTLASVLPAHFHSLDWEPQKSV